MSAPTQFVESNVILAMIEGDEEEVLRLLRSMNASERRALSAACMRVRALLEATRA